MSVTKVLLTFGSKHMVKITPGVGHAAPDVRYHGGAVGLTHSTTEELYSDHFYSDPHTMAGLRASDNQY